MYDFISWCLFVYWPELVIGLAMQTAAWFLYCAWRQGGFVVG